MTIYVYFIMSRKRYWFIKTSEKSSKNIYLCKASNFMNYRYVAVGENKHQMVRLFLFLVRKAEKNYLVQ
jgi:hypothetical protein